MAILQFFVVLVCASAEAAEPDGPETHGLDRSASYSATRILQTGDRAYTLLERRAPGKLRLDSCPEAQGCTYIVRNDLNQSFAIGNGSYVRGGYPAPYDPRRETFEVTESNVVASEAVNSLPSEKYRATFKLTHGQVGEGYYWVHEGIMIGVDLRYKTHDGSEQRMVMKLKDLDITEQDSAPFEVPEGFSDITNNI